jgi:hypothetical protein
MNKEQQELLGEAFLNYWKKVSVNNEEDCLVKQEEGSFLKEVRALYQQEFIDKCKTDTEFSERWGLKIEERELSLEERCSLANFAPFDDRFPDGDDFKWDEHTINIAEDWLKQRHPNLPTKLITITYKDKTIESYE